MSELERRKLRERVPKYLRDWWNGLCRAAYETSTLRTQSLPYELEGGRIVFLSPMESGTARAVSASRYPATPLRVLLDVENEVVCVGGPGVDCGPDARRSVVDQVIEAWPVASRSPQFVWERLLVHRMRLWHAYHAMGDAGLHGFAGVLESAIRSYDAGEAVAPSALLTWIRDTYSEDPYVVRNAAELAVHFAFAVRERLTVGAVVDGAPRRYLVRTLLKGPKVTSAAQVGCSRRMAEGLLVVNRTLAVERIVCPDESTLEA